MSDQASDGPAATGRAPAPEAAAGAAEPGSPEGAPAAPVPAAGGAAHGASARPPAPDGGAAEGAAAGPPAPAVRSRRRLWLRVLQVGLVAATVYFLAAYLVRSWSSVESFDWELRPEWLALSAVAFFVFYVMQALVWWLILRGVAVSTPLGAAAATWAKSILARYIPGNVFMFVGRAWLSHSQGLPVDRVSAAMVYEQVLGVCSALVTVALLFPFWEYHPDETAWSLLAIPVFMVLLHPRVFAPLAAWALRRLHRPPLEVTMAYGKVLALVAYFVVSWVVAGLGAWLLARGVTDLEVAALPLVVVAYALAYVLGMAAFIFPSGIGVREAVLTASLARHLPGGVALAWALLLRLWVTAVELVFVGVVVGTEALLRRRKEAA